MASFPVGNAGGPRPARGGRTACKSLTCSPLLSGRGQPCGQFGARHLNLPVDQELGRAWPVAYSLCVFYGEAASRASIAVCHTLRLVHPSRPVHCVTVRRLKAVPTSYDVGTAFRRRTALAGRSQIPRSHQQGIKRAEIMLHRTTLIRIRLILGVSVTSSISSQRDHLKTTPIANCIHRPIDPYTNKTWFLPWIKPYKIKYSKCTQNNVIYSNNCSVATTSENF